MSFEANLCDYFVSKHGHHKNRAIRNPLYKSSTRLSPKFEQFLISAISLISSFKAERNRQIADLQALGILLQLIFVVSWLYIL